MNEPLVALVILNYNGKYYLEKFLPSVFQYSPKETMIVVGDNASTDDSIDFLKVNYPEITLIQLNQNHGFAEGYNQVLKKVKADYYFLLNSDVELRNSWYPLVDALNINPGIAAAQPKILSYHQPDHFEHAGAAGGWIDALGYPFCKGRIFDHVEEDQHQYDQSTEIFWASGAAMIVRAELFHALGGFDGDYFAHMEEIDWCWRAKKNGWSILTIPKVTVFHIGGGTLPYQSHRKVYLNFRNNLATLIKNDSGVHLLYKLPLRFILDMIAAFTFLIQKKISSSLAVLKAYLHLIQWIPALLAKRKAIRQLSMGKPFNQKGLFSGILLIEYFIKGHKTFQSINPKL